MDNLTINKNKDGSFTIWDNNKKMKVFNGTTVIEVPTQIFKGTLEIAEANVAMATNNIASQQTQLANAQAVVLAINSYIPPVK